MRYCRALRLHHHNMRSILYYVALLLSSSSSSSSSLSSSSQASCQGFLVQTGGRSKGLTRRCPRRRSQQAANLALSDTMLPQHSASRAQLAVRRTLNDGRLSPHSASRALQVASEALNHAANRTPQAASVSLSDAAQVPHSVSRPPQAASESLNHALTIMYSGRRNAMRAGRIEPSSASSISGVHLSSIGVSTWKICY